MKMSTDYFIYLWNKKVFKTLDPMEFFFIIPSSTDIRTSKILFQKSENSQKSPIRFLTQNLFCHKN